MSASKNIWFSADYHLGHTNILKYDQRPFKTIEDHDEAIISNHNAVVKPTDDFYFLGDFCFNKNKGEEYIGRLMGNLHFISGNHDYSNTIKLYEKYGTYMGGLAEIKGYNRRIVLCHYRLEVWNGSHRGSWCIHGHSHGALHARPNTLDVGINTQISNYSPVSIARVKNHMNRFNTIGFDTAPNTVV